jgi:hypothetical protein
MATGSAGTASYTLVLNEAERAELLRLLEHTLGETRVEAHRTHTPAYRERVLGQEAVIRGLLEKLGRTPA